MPRGAAATPISPRPQLGTHFAREIAPPSLSDGDHTRAQRHAQRRDGRWTLTTSATYVYPSTGVSGEWADVAPTHCSTVLANIGASTAAVTTPGVSLNSDTGVSAFPIVSFSSSRTGGAAELKACLGDADGDTSTNTDVENWDYGIVSSTGELVWPHLVKFIREDATTAQDAVYSLLFYDSTTTNFHLGAGLSTDDVPASSDFELFTTDSTLQLVWSDEDADDVFDGNTGSEALYITGLADSNTTFTDGFYVTTSAAAGVDVSCEAAVSTISTCLEKGDQIVLHQAGNTWGLNSVNLFTITKIYDEDLSSITDELHFRIDVDRTMPQNYHGGSIYKYTAGSEPYTYVSECSGRGTCNEDDGLCECYRGYTGDDCATQSSFAT